MGLFFLLFRLRWISFFILLLVVHDFLSADIEYLLAAFH